MSTQFGDKYRRWARVTKATMRVTHKPGDVMQVDWAGGTIPYYDSVTGEEYKAYLFVAALREQKFISFAEVKDAVAKRLEVINTKPFQKCPGSRREAYLSEEKEFMLPLPKSPYEPSVRKQLSDFRRCKQILGAF